MVQQGARVREATSVSEATDPKKLTITFEVVRDFGGAWLKDVTWPTHQPSRKCVGQLQKEYGNDNMIVCLKHKGSLVSRNHSPHKA